MNIREYRQGIGWALSVTIHAVLLFTGTWLVVQAPKFSVEKPPPSVEVDLFAPPAPVPAPPIIQPVVTPPPAPPPSEPPPPLSPIPVVAPPPVVVMETPAPQPVEKPEFIQPVSPPVPERVPTPSPNPPAAQSLPTPPPVVMTKPVIGNGVTTSAKPTYLENPLPPYPDTSRRLHEQGTVQLLVKVDALGNPTETTVKQSSGYSRLDQAAKDWIQQHYKFQPATLNGQPVASEVTIPVRFSLQ